MGGDELLQLTWQKSDAFRYSARAGDDGHLKLQPGPTDRGHVNTPLQDGWGLASDGKSLLATDSGPDIFVLDPKTLGLRRSVQIEDQGRVVEMVNELEFIDGELWGNIYGQDCLARIDPESGDVRSWVVMQNILDRKAANLDAKRHKRELPDVLNGIAWDPEGRRLFVTGKLWPYLFEVEIVPAPQISLSEARSVCIPKHNIFRANA
eukprot:gnl/TRDRNA2_/TRDRNA2_157541_c0_seq2.p1 gnl/TRDRNA2_/TRDRNA2_157541_c0~~gnl/TRDRNA2_/TRDRNA2_157541_c0_seq2.p1  ORF type:complete len:239 (+),score=59.11 gnl/TRDRNA2_/TRDRNA2_157541_c0_seq2:97-717(+)